MQINFLFSFSKVVIFQSLKTGGRTLDVSQTQICVEKRFPDGKYNNNVYESSFFAANIIQQDEKKSIYRDCMMQRLDATTSSQQFWKENALCGQTRNKTEESIRIDGLDRANIRPRFLRFQTLFRGLESWLAVVNRYHYYVTQRCCCTTKMPARTIYMPRYQLVLYEVIL